MTPDGTNKRRRETIGAVDHAVDFLRCLSDAGVPLGTNDIARRIGMHKSSVSRLAATLERARLIQRDAETERLSLGVGMVALAAPVLARFEVRDLVRPLLKELATETGETVSFSLWNGDEAVSIEQAPGSNAVQAFSRPGHRNPGHATAVGKVLLAHLGEAAIETYCATPLRRYTETTIVDPAALKIHLAQCRTQRYALNLGEFESDVGAVSAIVFDRDAQVLGAVTATVPMYRFNEVLREQLAYAVRGVAADLSGKLGFAMPDQKHAIA